MTSLIVKDSVLLELLMCFSINKVRIYLYQTLYLKALQMTFLHTSLADYRTLAFVYIFGLCYNPSDPGLWACSSAG